MYNQYKKLKDLGFTDEQIAKVMEISVEDVQKIKYQVYLDKANSQLNKLVERSSDVAHRAQDMFNKLVESDEFQDAKTKTKETYHNLRDRVNQKIQNYQQSKSNENETNVFVDTTNDEQVKALKLIMLDDAEQLDFLRNEYGLTITNVPVAPNKAITFIELPGKHEFDEVSEGDYLILTNDEMEQAIAIVPKETFNVKYKPANFKSETDDDYTNILKRVRFHEKPGDYVSHPRTILSNLVNELGQLNGEYNANGNVSPETIAEAMSDLIRLAYDQDLDAEEIAQLVKQNLNK